MKNKISLAGFLAALFTFTMIHAQNPVTKVFEDWNTEEATQNTFQHSVVRSKGLGGTTYHYVAGATLNPNGGGYDMLVSKYNSSGTILWTQTYNGAGNGDDVATDVQIDAVGNVYICGSYYKNATDSNNAVIIKYNNAGTQQWVYTYNGAGSRHDGFAAMSAAGNTIIACGTTWRNSTNMYNILAIRVDSSGSNVWTTDWDYANLNDGAHNLYSVSGALYVAGGVQSATTTYKYAALKMNASTGAVGSSTVTGGTGFGIDQIADIQTDAATGNVFITGSVFNATTLYDFRTIMLDSTLSIVWSATYDAGNNLNDFGTGIKIDANSNVIVTGSSRTASNGNDFTTIKYNSSGTQMWVANYDGGIAADDSATAIVINDTNQIYVTGYSFNGSTNDYYTIRYDDAGNQVFGIGFNSIHNADDRASAIALDTLGNVIVTGQNKINDSTFTYTTVKYIEKNTMYPQDTVAVTSNSFVYTENRGQLVNTNGVSIPEIQYYTIHGSPNVYFSDTAVSYVLAKLDTSSSHIDTLARIDMKFVNANSDLKIRSMDVRDEYENFFLGHIPEGRCGVRNYDKLVSFNVWNNVDMIYGSNMMGMKYYFICKPGGGGTPYTSIDLKYEGADSVKIDGSGQLIIYTKLGNIVQPKAAAWQIDANGNYSSLGWQPSYNIVATNEVKFTSLGSYNSAQPLVFAVDWGYEQLLSVTNPAWSTYLGGPSNDWGTGIKIDPSNLRVNIVGHTFSTAFPVFSGYDMSQNGTVDIIIGCFNFSRSLRWMTYYGGNSDDLGYELSLSGSSLYCTGTTASNNFPLLNLPGAYNEGTTNNTITAFILRFNSTTGSREWATRFGSNGTAAISILADPSTNDFYLSGSTTNTAGNTSCGPPTNGGFPLCNPGGSAFYDGTGSNEAYISKFSGTGQLLWSTYFGGNNLDQILDLSLGSNNLLYVAGYTTSNSGFPLQSPPSGTYYQSSFAGIRDGFLAEFDRTSLALN